MAETDPVMHTYRLRNMGNLLYLCREWSRSVAHFAAMPTPTTFHAGLRDLGMARSLVKLGASAEARTLLHSGKQSVGGMPYGYTRDLIGTLETALN